jgi:hypothetical protein
MGTVQASITGGTRPMSVYLIDVDDLGDRRSRALEAPPEAKMLNLRSRREFYWRWNQGALGFAPVTCVASLACSRFLQTAYSW